MAGSESIEWLFGVHLTPAGLLQFDPMTPHDPAAMELTPYQEISRVDIGHFWCDVIRRDGTLLVQECVLEWDLLPGALLLKRLIEVPDVRRAAAASPTTASA